MSDEQCDCGHFESEHNTSKTYGFGARTTCACDKCECDGFVQDTSIRVEKLEAEIARLKRFETAAIKYIELRTNGKRDMQTLDECGQAWEELMYAALQEKQEP